MPATEQRYNISDLPKLSETLSAILQAGNEVVLYQAGQPMARIVPYPKRVKRVLGEAKGMVKIHPDFEKLPDDFMEFFK
jgi:antitoxin (DNA-binding transcriptional repressor) of toxin-antitoxin stability system